MMCKQCSATYVSLPCPSCNWDGGKVETTNKVEKTIRPSELRGGSAVNPKIRNEQFTHDGEDHLIKPSEKLKNENQKKYQEEEHVVKPSDTIHGRNDNTSERLVKQSQVFNRDVVFQTKENEEERLVKPSQLFNQVEKNNDILLKPSQLRGTSGRDFSKKEQTKQSISNVKDGLSTFSDKLENAEDKAFKSNVKDTLLEVITLLEKLIEE